MITFPYFTSQPVTLSYMPYETLLNIVTFWSLSGQSPTMHLRLNKQSIIPVSMVRERPQKQKLYLTFFKFAKKST